jgi:GNAT superfamily N-acetyltransferase
MDARTEHEPTTAREMTGPEALAAPWTKASLGTVEMPPATKPLDLDAIEARAIAALAQRDPAEPHGCDELHELAAPAIALVAEVRRLFRENATLERQRDAVAALREREIARAPKNLEPRLVAAWRASGMGLGKLLVLAANEYAIGAAVGLPSLADEAMVSMAERYATEHPEAT